MVQPADRDRVFIADLSAESTGLSKPNVMGLGRRGAAHDARLGPDELAVVLVAQANRLGGHATASYVRLGKQWVKRPALHRRKESLVCSQGRFASRRFKTIAWLIGWLHPS
jgi:hypothetical protein